MAESTPSPATTTASERMLDFSSLDAVVRDGVADGAYPGAAYAVGINGRVAHLATAGRFMYCPDSPAVVPNTIWDLASLSKVIGCTTAAMILFDEGKLELDKPVAEYIPEFGQKDKQKITVRNLLLHNSGFPGGIPRVTSYATGDALMAGVYALPLRYPTGTDTIYSDLSVMTLGKVIEKITGVTLAAFVQDRVFAPLGMTGSMYTPGEAVRPHVAPTETVAEWREKLREARGQKFRKTEGCHPDAHLYIQGEVHDPSAAVLDGISGNAGVFSNAPDLCTFAQMMLDLGRFQGRQIIKADTVKSWTKRQSDASSRALGWDTPRGPFSGFSGRFSRDSYGHTGYTGTSIWIDPANNCYAIYLTNRVHPTSNNGKLVQTYRPRFHHAIADLLGLPAAPTTRRGATTRT